MKLNQTELDAMPVDDKMHMIEQLWNSMNDVGTELTAQQKHELDLRLQKIKDGKAVFVSWEEARTRVKS